MSVRGAPWPRGRHTCSAPPNLSERKRPSRRPAPDKSALLLISAKGDRVFPPGTGETIAARHTGREDVLVEPSSGHALAIRDSEHAREVRSAIYRSLTRVTS